MPKNPKTIFPKRKPVSPDEDTKPKSSRGKLPSAPTSFFVSKPLYKKSKSKDHSARNDSQDSRSSKDRKEPLKRPFLFPKGVPKKSVSDRPALLPRVASSIRDKIETTAQDWKIKRDMREARREREKAERARSAPVEKSKPSRPTPPVDPQAARFERLKAIYEEVYGENSSNFMVSLEEAYRSK